MSFRALTWPHRTQLALLQVGLRSRSRCARWSCQPLLHAATAGVPGSVQPTRKHDTATELGSTPATQNVGSTAVWSGFPGWRSLQVDTRRRWGRLQCEEGESAAAVTAAEIELPATLSECACLVLRTAEPDLKAALSHRIWDAHSLAPLPLTCASAALPPDMPSRPPKPQLLPPKQVPTQKQSALPLNVYQLLNLAHVELNAIDLAWDTVARFAHVGLPAAFFDDFAHVADDESRHFGWCSQRLKELGHEYGDMPAHSILWQGAQASATDIGARLAIVPMGSEARGLDAAPRLAQRLRSANDHPTAALVDTIGGQEKAHVAVGVYWFSQISAALGQDSGESFRAWVSELAPGLLQGHMEHDARAEVGLQRHWYDRSLWPATQQVDVPATDLAKLRAQLAALLSECGDLTSCQG